MSKSPTASMDPAAGPAPSAPPPGSQVGLKSGSKLGKYEIVGRLGLGGMALVYKGYDPLLDRFVAIKQIASHLAADPKFMDRFRKEAQILAKLGADQVSVVQIYELIEDPRGLFIVMEYVEGQTLDVLIERQRGPMPVQLALEVLWHVTVGLRAVHERGIIHRDIKPANIMVGVNHRCKIADFGVAARRGGKTSMTLGTTKYMAPELFSGQEVDGRVDIYSLGCLAYEMLCGTEKFNEIFKDIVRDEQAESLRWMKWHTNLDLMGPLLHNVNPRVPEILGKIVAKMMAKNPEQRFASADHLLEIFKRHFTQQGQIKQAGAAAAKREAKAAPPAPVERRPEPIPERAGEAPVPAPAPEPIPKAPGAPRTTVLPKRKMTRRQRLTVLAALLGAIVAVFIGLWVYDATKKGAIEDRALRIYDKARTLWTAGEYAKARDLLLRLRVDDEAVAAAGEAVAKADAHLRTRLDEEEAKKAQQEYDRAAARVKQLREDRKLAETKYARVYAPLRLTWLEGRQAILDRDWARAEAAEKKMFEQVKQLTPQEGRKFKQELSDFRKERRYERDFVEKVDEAMALIDLGLKEMDPRLFDRAKETLDVAQAIKKGENLEKQYGLLVASKSEHEYRELMAEAQAAEAARPDEAVDLYRKAQAILNKPEVQKRLDTLGENRQFNQHMTRAKAAYDAGNAAEALRSYESANRIRPSVQLTKMITQVKARDAYVRGETALKRGQETTAEQWLNKAKTLDPRLTKNVDKLLATIKNRNEFLSLVRGGDQALASGDFTVAIQQYKAAQKLQKDDKVTEKIRQASHRHKMKQAEDFARKGKWREAEWSFKGARNLLRANEASLRTRIDRRLVELERDKNYQARRDEGDKLFAAGKFDDALRRYKDAKLVLVNAKADTREIEVRIREANYARFLHSAKVDMERGLWRSALSWLARAKEQKPTDEVDRLTAEVNIKIEAEAAKQTG